MKVVRERYLRQLWAKRHNGLVKIITGIRRSGKSYLLGTLFRERLLAEGVDSRHIIEIPLDRKVLPPGVDLSRLAPEDREDAYVTFYDTLNELRQMEKVDVYVTGANSKTLSRDIDTNFADRGCQIRVHPFSFAESCEATHPADKAEAFAKYLVWGGMPLAVAEADDRERASRFQGCRAFPHDGERDLRRADAQGVPGRRGGRADRFGAAAISLRALSLRKGCSRP